MVQIAANSPHARAATRGGDRSARASQACPECSDSGKVWIVCPDAGAVKVTCSCRKPDDRASSISVIDIGLFTMLLSGCGVLFFWF